MATTTELYNQVRAICLALPETNERPSHGEAAFFIRDKKQFLMCANNHHNDGRIAVWLACEKEVQRSLVAEQPQHFFVPPYVGVRGWLGICLDTGLPPAELEALIQDAYLLVAPVKLAARLNESAMA